MPHKNNKKTFTIIINLPDQQTNVQMTYLPSSKYKYSDIEPLRAYSNAIPYQFNLHSFLFIKVAFHLSSKHICSLLYDLPVSPVIYIKKTLILV